MPTKASKKVVGMIIRSRKTIMKDGVMTTSGIGEPSIYHALVVIFLEFFAWGLLTMPIISVLNETFPDHTFLMNGLIMGIKGFLSFLSAPLIGALSDVWGRKFFLLITVFFTCAPIPLMTINTWWFFAMISISGVFAVTFSVVFAYVADVTEEHERSLAYGLVSATFAASMVISPALGAYMMDAYSENLVVALATAIAILDVFFILVAVPESLPEKVRPSSWGAPISWEQADPFAALRKVGKDHTILMLCVTVFLSYLPEAGQYSCIFVYLKLVMDFSVVMVAVFIATVGILSVGAQIILGFLMRSLGSKHTIIVGLVFEMLQLMWYGFGSQTWMMWAAGVLASISSITYPAISAFVSMHSDADKQGLVQGMVTGMRGLCNGLGPAMFGVIFYLFHVDLNEDPSKIRSERPINLGDNGTTGQMHDSLQPLVPGPPFVFGSFLVICALLVAVFIPEGNSMGSNLRTNSRRQSGLSMEVHYEVERSKKHDGVSPLSPLVDNSAIL
ncbi:hippocampus abundant transcript 1 protein [Schistocerca americana]|uniref:hippocampus abundant transcript 1 protein n=1 Tax=Schistocerca americana TaxID=7009 RepID=UPI001F4F2E45|nr:hippocampus abundant transcript 1 protein [Schistocerca americana]XP_047102352.1 hippocampus abundant transcript 1 protein [Schistocerca piceifrons]XP_049780959.1 hippocampus abundant transcript 1 protein [Schistocerca cancellata]XP_049804557.1 hippocampus abundant transcript 1 protein [Schistocerca nitens]XP_049844995.1 hippocampus abundant transcript 1 protein [Schistocerca gregaria]XP_049955609.1 hippocampus abundant transcript 1 protein [Schistocerca serialis cubense]